MYKKEKNESEVVSLTQYAVTCIAHICCQPTRGIANKRMFGHHIMLHVPHVADDDVDHQETQRMAGQTNLSVIPSKSRISTCRGDKSKAIPEIHEDLKSRTRERFDAMFHWLLCDPTFLTNSVSLTLNTRKQLCNATQKKSSTSLNIQGRRCGAFYRSCAT